MTTLRSTLRPIAFAMLFAAGASHAAITSTSATSANGFAGSVSGAIDTFSNLTINDVLASPLTRTAGGIGYTLSTQTSFIVNPVASFISPGTSVYNDTITFSGFTSEVHAFGTYVTGVNDLGETSGGALTVVVTDTNGLSFTSSVTGGSLSGPGGTAGFASFLSDAPIASVVVSITTPNTNVWATVDNTVLAVPESGTWLMMLAGGAAVLRLAARRRG